MTYNFADTTSSHTLSRSAALPTLAAVPTQSMPLRRSSSSVLSTLACAAIGLQLSRPSVMPAWHHPDKANKPLFWSRRQALRPRRPAYVLCPDQCQPLKRSRALPCPQSAAVRLASLEIALLSDKNKAPSKKQSMYIVRSESAAL